MRDRWHRTWSDVFVTGLVGSNKGSTLSSHAMGSSLELNHVVEVWQLLRMDSNEVGVLHFWGSRLC